ncbi:hypothetical protein P3T23_009511 [Paraburkholderia sp. GAS448]|uniref:hypothetical protein n=1 Tax=Paraburkholderia sp. GAS448 TaxID=3035136 RepID=UPI003D1D6208
MKIVTAADLNLIRSSMPTSLKGRLIVDSLVMGYPQLGVLHEGRSITAPCFDTKMSASVDPSQYGLSSEEARFIVATNDRLKAEYAST